MKRTIVLPTLLFTLKASAECPSSIPAQRPAIPDGPTASELLDRAISAFDAYTWLLKVFKRKKDMLARN